MNDEASLFRQIIADLDANLPLWYQGSVPLSDLLPRLRSRKRSFTLRYPFQMAGGGRSALHVKIPRGAEALSLPQAVASPSLKAAGYCEFTAICRVAEIIAQAADPFFVSLKPVGYLPRWNAILTEELPGRPLDAMLLDPRLRLGLPGLRRRFEAALFHAGRWLRVYHDGCGDAQPGLMRIANIPSRVSSKILQLNQKFVQRLRLNDLERAFQAVLELNDRIEVPFVTQHGDFYCRNVLLTPDDRVCVIDFDPEMNKRAPLYHDLSTLIADLWVQKVKVHSLGFLIRSDYLCRCEMNILRGYYQAEGGVREWGSEQFLLSLFCATSTFDALHWYGMRQPTNFVEQVLHIPILQYLRHISQKYLDAITTQALL